MLAIYCEILLRSFKVNGNACGRILGVVKDCPMVLHVLYFVLCNALVSCKTEHPSDHAPRGFAAHLYSVQK